MDSGTAKRILKIDINQLGYQDTPECSCSVGGKDKDGDNISIFLRGFEAQSILRTVQMIAKKHILAIEQVHEEIAEEQDNVQ